MDNYKDIIESKLEDLQVFFRSFYWFKKMKHVKQVRVKARLKRNFPIYGVSRCRVRSNHRHHFDFTF